VLRVPGALHPRSGWAAAVVIAAIVSACTSGTGASSSPSSSATTPSEQAALPSVEASPEETPIPTPSATPSPTPPPPGLVDLDPVDGTVLPIAGRNGAPGAISCNGLGRFTYDWLLAQPTGAEKLSGPEFDVLRDTIQRYGNDSEFGFDGLTFREGHRDAAKVVFLGDRGGPEGPFAHIDVAFDGATWKWAGMSGGCRLVGEPGDGWGSANWVLDPKFDGPTSKTRKLHLLVSEADCNPSVPIAGRLAPAFVFFEPRRVRIQLFIQVVDPPGSCDGLAPTELGPPTAVTLVIPEPLGSRKLEDVTPEPCRGCGG
jgi:hypothetical protein